MRFATLVLVGACSRSEPIATCSDELAGVYEVETTATEEHPARWHVLDYRRAIEAYPLFDDTPDAAALEVAPRAIDLRRSPDGFAGTTTRRYMRGTQRCDAKTPARVTACTNDTLEIVLSDPAPPIAFEPCAYGQAAPSRRERWRRVR